MCLVDLKNNAPIVIQKVFALPLCHYRGEINITIGHVVLKGLQCSQKIEYTESTTSSGKWK